ncbi:MAG: hypothetical protein WAZ14_01250 [Patescibacteria group bacterium]
MQISDHYRAFEGKLVIAVTNNEKARLICAEGREVEEIELIALPETATEERSGVPGPNPNFDALKEQRLKQLYTALGDRLQDMLVHEGYDKAIVCVPEVNKNFFNEYLPTDVQKRISEVIPKNLASMDIPHIIRILLEG